MQYIFLYLGIKIYSVAKNYFMGHFKGYFEVAKTFLTHK
jgi:hypothetical protein